MFEALSDRFDGIFKRLRGRGRCARTTSTRSSARSGVALLEADVNFKVVRGLVDRIRERGVGAELQRGLNPAAAGHQDRPRGAHRAPSAARRCGSPTPRSRPTVVLMAGLQGSGKTTTRPSSPAGSRPQGRNPLLVGADLQRPAAVEQLRTLGRQVDVPVLLDDVAIGGEGGDPVEVARRASRRPAGSVATSSSSTPPAAWPSTPR